MNLTGSEAHQLVSVRLYKQSPKWRLALERGTWGRNSVGRVLALQARCRGFEPRRLHHIKYPFSSIGELLFYKQRTEERNLQGVPYLINYTLFHYTILTRGRPSYKKTLIKIVSRFGSYITIETLGTYTVDSSGADCKSVGLASGGATPSVPTIWGR